MMKDQDLWQRIEAFDIDGGERPDKRFSARLADENGWSRAFGERVIAEYKRYIYLAMTHGRPVCPSDQVDEAWHLHLTYTRSYWSRFCRDTLGRDLHHEPTRGGAEEDGKHRQMYEETLEAYRAAFGEEPPSDIWPSVAKRFPGMSTERYQALTLLSLNPSVLIIIASLAIVVWSLVGSLDPFALHGGLFLLVLIPAFAAAIASGRIVHEWARLRNTITFRRVDPLSWDEAAFVAGGSGRLSSATMARLVGSGLIRISDDRTQLLRTGKPAIGASAVEEAVLRHMPITKGTSSTGQSFTAMEADVELAFRKTRNALEADGVIIPEQQMFVAWLMALIPLGLVMIGLALPRLFLGLASNKPVFFLVMAIIAATIAGFLMVRPGTPNHRTQKGDALLERTKSEYAPLRDGEGIGKIAGLATGAAAGLGVALFGMSALANSEMAELSDLDVFLPTRAGQSSGCGGGCGSSTSGGGDGSSGCSGCGGGGD